MKKFLSLISAFGLTVTTASTLVGCSTKEVTTRFEDLSSINKGTWKGQTLGALNTGDLTSGTVGENTGAVVANKEKIAAYIGAGFDNYTTVYQKIMKEATVVGIYRRQENTNRYVLVQPSDYENSSKPVETWFFQVSDGSTKKSALLPVNVILNPNQQNVFDLEPWLSSNSEFLIPVNKVRNQTTKIPATDTNLTMMQEIFNQIIKKWEQIKGYKSSDPESGYWPVADQAINNVFTYLGAYLVNCEGYESATTSDSPPLTIQNQFKNTFNENSEAKNEARDALLRSWRQTDIDSTPSLVIELTLKNQTVKITLDFDDTSN